MIRHSIFAILCCLTNLIYAQQYKIRVHVLGHDGKPMKESHASLTQYKPDGTAKILPSRTRTNEYEFIVNARGTYFMRLTGTHHRAANCPILVEGDSLIDMEIRLGTMTKEMASPDSVFLSGSFNGFSLDQGIQKMTRQKNGTYVARLPSRGNTALMCRPLIFVDGEAIPVDMTDGSTFKHDSNRYTGWLSGNYYARIETNHDKTKVKFDPARLLTSDLPTRVHFSNSHTTTAKLLTAYLAADFRLMKFRLASYNFLETRQLGDFDDFVNSYNIDKDLSYLASMASSTTDQIAKDVYNIATFHFSPNDSSSAKKLWQGVSPNSPVWKIGYSWTRHFLGALPDAKEAAVFAEEIAAAQYDAGLKAGYLGFALDVYHRQNDEKNFGRLYNDAMREFEAYPGFLESIKSRNPINRKIVVGKIIPHFSFVSLDGAEQLITPGQLLGKTYLIDLWATWCAPCVAEMKNLHQTYEQFKDKGFTVVSISFDETPDVVAKFRQKKWAMPWYNAFAGKHGGEAPNRVFEQQGLPRAILVDTQGVIVAIDEQIKGEKLYQVLQTMLDNK